MKSKKRKKNALVVCRNKSQFWTTQKQFWQWAREGVLMKTGDNPLTGKFVKEDQEKMVTIANTVLNLNYTNHLSEALLQRQFSHR